MSSSLSPDIQSLFEAALKEYEKRAGTNLIENELSSKLRSCHSPEDVLLVLQKQAKAFQEYRGDPKGKVIRRLKQVVNVLYSVSTSDVLVESVGIVGLVLFFTLIRQSFLFSRSRLQKHFSQESVSSLQYVSPSSLLKNSTNDICNHQAIKDVSASYDALVELFELIENFLKRLNVYTKVPSTTALTEIVVKILVELLATVALATQQVKQGKLSEPFSVETSFFAQ